ncbi:hypothetical protein [Vibrio phage PhiImVa-1]|nr:hypothetical protein [Vibrio phage PhiImVa-1]
MKVSKKVEKALRQAKLLGAPRHTKENSICQWKRKSNK